MKNIICKLFGHKRKERFLSGYYKKGKAIWFEDIFKKCPRCGVKL